MLRSPHCIDNRLTDGVDVSPTQCSRSRKYFVPVCGTDSTWRLCNPQDSSTAGRIREIDTVVLPRQVSNPVSFRLVIQGLNTTLNHGNRYSENAVDMLGNSGGSAVSEGRVCFICCPLVPRC
jgi:hypothetical protein